MRQIAIFTMGTRGDVQPYLELGRALTEAGMGVTLGTHPCWEGLVRAAGIGFAPIGPDIDIQQEAAAIRGRSKSPMTSMLKTMNFVFQIIKNASGDIYASCRDKDLIVVSHSQMGATEAEALGLPTVNVTLQTEMIAQPGRPRGPGGRAIDALIGRQMARPYNKIRKLYGLGRVRSMDEVMSPRLNLIPISRYVVQANPYWDGRNQIVGYWYHEDEGYQPPEALRAFLEAGEPPAILALGAMAFESRQEREKLDLFVRALQNAGMRAVIQGFNKSLEGYELPGTMLSCGAAPHSWLFRQGGCVIHHCGFGTSAAAMLYGAPSVPVPHVLDQFAFAQRLYELGVGVEPVRADALSEQRLTRALEQVKDQREALAGRAAALSRKMRAENGLEKAVALIQDVLENP